MNGQALCVAAMLDRDTYEQLGRLAVENDRSLAAEVRRAVREHLHSAVKGGASRAAVGASPEGETR